MTIRLLWAVALAGSFCQGQVAWPEITRECRPWSYWWWMGSAVDSGNLTRELQRYRDAGWGGVHIIPIYGAKGYEERYIEYLSPEWMAMLRHAVSEGARLGMGVDMTTGTGWCFGGPNITPELACTQVVPQRQAGGWSVSMKACDVPVKRAAPGGAGPMLNPFSRAAVEHYLARFSAAFKAYGGPKPRSMYHDSFEYRANWSPDMFEQFERRRGYDLRKHLDALFGDDLSDRAARVKSDYRETLSDALVEDFIPTWAGWSRQLGVQTRNQAHGSPGNLLDLYAAADIPETEMFYQDRSSVISKFASSAAHVAGRKLVSSETGTWLKEHFNETLADLKDLIDQLFLAGVNHIIYHGTCYSPDEAPWPGWLFYASTQMNPRNPIWRDVPALNEYIARSQAVLQSGRPDSDFLLYWPIYDVWHNPQGLNINMTVHNREWLEQQPFGRLAQRLFDRGYSFDYVSDRQLGAVVRGENHKVIAAPVCDHMPVGTLKSLLALAGEGATVVFAERLPADVPGFGDIEKRRAEFRGLLAPLKLTGTGPVREGRHGKGRILVGDLEAALALAKIPRETMAEDVGLQCLRLRTESGNTYFIANRGGRPVDGWVRLGRSAVAAALMDPKSGRIGIAALRQQPSRTEVYLQLQPGESIFVRAFSKSPRGTPWIYWKDSGDSVTLPGPWRVKFVAGGPESPTAFESNRLESWTVRGASEERFGGTALYTTMFDAPARQAGAWTLDLGTVRESARVRVNGREYGTVFMAPYRVRVNELKPRGNVLEVEVTNLAANRIRDMDRRGIVWKVFHDANVVNIDYKPFDASGWAVRESGLPGPVTLRTCGEQVPSVRP